MDTCTFMQIVETLILEDKCARAVDVLLEVVPVNETEFCDMLRILNAMLDSSSKRNSLQLIFSNFSKALKKFPNNTSLLIDLASYLYKYGCHNEALEQFEQVLKLCPTYAMVEKNINSIKNLLVERWHYRMLNDNLRNESYRQAIHQLVHSKKHRVLDVGTGTGLLAIYAHEAGASNVIGCDGSKVMCRLAESITHDNQINNITILNKMSTDLKHTNLNGRCSMLVTEMFDAGLFGEHVLQMLSHAWPNLLAKKAVVVPNSAEFFVMGVECDHLSINYKLSSSAKSLINISSINVHVTSQNEAYDSEDVHLIKDIRYLTEPKSILKINYYDIEDITRHLNRIDPFEVELVVKENGQINVVIGWFNLYLTDLVTITTDPRAPDRANAWQQAVFFDDIPRMVKENETIYLKFLMNGGNLTMMPTSESLITRVSPEIVKFLNDTEYVKLINSSVPVACAHLKKIKEMGKLFIVDLCPFPLFGLEMLKLGAKSVTCCASNDNDKDFIMKVFLENQIQESKVTILIGSDWNVENFEENWYHVVFSHTFELGGDIDFSHQQVADYLRTNKLVQGGLFLPAQVNLVAQLVSSHWLDLNNRLYDDNVSSYEMATHLNEYKVTQNFAIDFSTLKYVPITEPVEVCPYPNANKYDETSAKIITDGYANAILCWYNIVLMEQMQVISTNRPSSFISGMLFLTYSKEQLIANNMAKIILHQDPDGTFKMVMEQPTLLKE